jgi:hypothetical protein
MRFCSGQAAREAEPGQFSGAYGEFLGHTTTHGWPTLSAYRKCAGAELFRDTKCVPAGICAIANIQVARPFAGTCGNWHSLVSGLGQPRFLNRIPMVLGGYPDGSKNG